jgi:hypothetical protein
MRGVLGQIEVAKSNGKTTPATSREAGISRNPLRRKWQLIGQSIDDGFAKFD